MCSRGILCGVSGKAWLRPGDVHRRGFGKMQSCFLARLLVHYINSEKMAQCMSYVEPPQLCLQPQALLCICLHFAVDSLT